MKQPQRDSLTIGLIGCGDMGLLYARSFVAAGWERVVLCDLPSKTAALRAEFQSVPQVRVMDNGFAVARAADFLIYSVEAGSIESVVATYGPATKVGAIVCGQTSVKEPEIKAFEKHLPSDVHIVTCHSLHGPRVDPSGQPLVVIRHRASNEAHETALNVLSALRSQMVHLSYKEHDQITADTQAVTHVAYLSMGTAWKTKATFPWENTRYLGGIDNVKILMALRIFGNKWHVYAGLAIMNPAAKRQVEQYAKSVADLFTLMIQERRDELSHRVKTASEFVFGGEYKERNPILLSDSLLDQFSLSAIPVSDRKPNSHLSLLAMVDCWHTLGIRPYKHLICQTPPFRLLLGITEYLFSNQDLLDQTLEAAVSSKEIRGDDLEFYRAASGWVDVITYESMEGYQARFEDTSVFFKDRIPEASKKSAQMIALITEKTRSNGPGRIL